MTQNPDSISIRSSDDYIWKHFFQLSESLRATFLVLTIITLFIYQIFTQISYAQGVAAGTDIANTVVVNYQVGGVSQDPVESSPTGNNTPGIGQGQATVFKVDRKIDLSVTATSDTSVTPGETQAQLSFTLKNEGNATQIFSLIPDSTLTSDDFDAINCSATNNPITLDADQQASIIVKCDIPAVVNAQAMQAGDTSIISLFATAEKNEDNTPVVESTDADVIDGIDTVFADSAGTDDVVRDAMHTARSSYIAATSAQPPTSQPDSASSPKVPSPANPVTLPAIASNDSDADGTVDVTSIDLDPATPGIQKTLTTNDGSWLVDNAGNVTFTPAADWTGYQSSISYTINDNDGIVSSPAELTVSYGHPPVALNDSSTNNTLGNSVSLNPLDNDSDADGNNTLDKTTVVFVGAGISADGKRKTVANEGTWNIDPLTGVITFTPLASFSGDPTDVRYTVEDTAGNLSNEASVHIDYKQITNTADLSINKSIVSMRDPDGGNKAISGSVVTYKISVNTTGTGNIDNVVITDPTPVDMTYKPNSMHLDNSLLTDIQDTDKADFGVTNPDTATLKLGNITAGSQYEILLSFVIN